MFASGPHEALIVYGFEGRASAGSGTIIFRWWRVAATLLELMSFDVAPRRILHRAGVAVTVEAVAQIK